MATRVVIGAENLKEFNHTLNDVEIFMARLQQFFIVNEIKESEKQRAYLLNLLAEDTYKLLVNLCVPDKPEEISFKELKTILKNHLQPVRSHFAARCEFYNAKKKLGESVAEWTARIRSMAAKCSFSNDELQTVLRDVFVIGMVPSQIMDRLLEEDATKVSFQRLQEIALAKEAALREHRGDAETGNQVTSFKIKSEPAETYQQKQVYKKQGQCKSDKGIQNKFCTVCGKKNHETSKCFFKNCKCHSCGYKGHISTNCKNKISNKKIVKKHNINYSEIDSEPMYHMKDSFKSVSEPININLTIENKEFTFQIDTGSQYSAVSETFYLRHLQNKYKLIKSDITLKDYAGFIFKPIGKVFLCAEYKKRVAKIETLIIKNGGLPLLGRNGLNCLKLEIKEINFINPINKINKLIQEYDVLFKDEIGTFTKGKFDLTLEEGANPKFLKARPLAFAMKSKVEDEINRLIDRNILIPTDNSEWATPVVPIIKPNGSVRLCGDFKCTLNPVLKNVTYPLPRIEYIFEKLRGGQKFSKIDLSEAYQQVLLTNESSKLVTITTHKGLFRYSRLPYGIKSGPALFQRLMENLLADMPGVACFIDDILVTAPNDETHIRNLENVFKKLLEYGLRLKKEKCKFLKNSINYLGHLIDNEGLHTTSERIKAINEAKAPQNITEVRAFLGMINFYNKFIPNASSVLYPLYKLLQKNEKFSWSGDCERSFKKIKKILTSPTVLVHFEPKYPIKLTVDASNYGIGAVLAHVFKNGVRPIAYSSRVLNKSEKNYSQIEKEALAIKFGIQKFYQYLFGQKFTLETDHKPLVTIFGPKKGIPIMAANRLQRWASFLSGFDFDIVYVKTDKNTSDWLSRSATDKDDNTAKEENKLSNINFISINTNLNINKIKNATKNDKILSKVMFYTRQGWPKQIKEKELQPYFMRNEEITIEKDCLFWGYKLIIPNSIKHQVLDELHNSHLGIVKMKSIARSYFWWPHIDENIEEFVQNCKACNYYKLSPEKSELIVWEYPEKPWTRLHLDFFEIFNKNFLVLIDATSKWIECWEMTNIRSELTITKLREIFARFGLPEMIVTDNAKTFTSTEFQIFCQNNGIIHRTGAPFHASTNGLAENAVKLLKNCIKKVKFQNKNENVETIINRFLFQYRNTIHSTTEECPAKILIGRKLKCKLDLLVPKTTYLVKNNQNKQIKNYSGKRNESFKENDQIFCKDYRNPKKISWIGAKILKVLGARTYIVETDEGEEWKRHLDQIRKSRVITLNKDHISKTNKNISSKNPNENFIPRSTLDRKSDEIVKQENLITNNDNCAEMENTISQNTPRYNFRNRKKT